MTNPRHAAPPAPVIVFAYARPQHLQRTVASLLANPQSIETDVYFFCDGAKRAEHAAQVQEVRAFIDSVDGFRSVSRVYRDTNMGLAASVIDGVTQVLAVHGRAIVVEDDLLLSPHFLQYMNDGLQCYADCDKVASIHAYSLPTTSPLPQTYFLRGADCWGWATWQRAWSLFRPDGTVLLEELKARGLTQNFDFDGSYPYTRMLEDQIAGRNDSWAIRWHASCYLADRLTLYPGRSLVHNIGNDASGTHSANTSIYAQRVAQEPVAVTLQPLRVSEDARASIVRYLRSCRPGAGRRLGAWLRRRLRMAA